MTSGLNLNQVVSWHRDGDLSGAEQGYRILISENVQHPDLFGNLAVICLDTGRADEAVNLLQSSLRLNPGRADTYFNLGVAYQNQGRLEDAISSYQQALAINPSNPFALNNLAMVLQQQHRLEEAISALKRAIELKPDYYQACLNLGMALHEQGQLELAISAYRKAIELSPDYFQAYFKLGVALQEQGQSEEAISSYRKVIEINPDVAEAYLNLGVTLANSCDLPKLDEAIYYYRKTLEVKPDCAEAYSNLGLAFQTQRKPDEAVDYFRKAIELNPGRPDSYDHMGFALRQQDRLDDAVSCYRKAIELRTASLGSNGRGRILAGVLSELDRLPIIYTDVTDIKHFRDNFTACLNKAAALVSRVENTLSGEERQILQTVLFRTSNFYLAYQQLNDRDLQVTYSTLATKIFAHEMKEYLVASRAPRSDAKIRLGLISEFLGSHNGCFWSYNWLANLPREDYEFFLYSLNGRNDEGTKRFAALGTYRWLPFRQNTYQKSLQIVKEDNLDILLFTDVGMTSLSRIISLARLAPIQCAAWGHPITTGSPSMDYFLSSEFMEPEGADSHYCEQLIRLPNLGLDFDHPAVPSETPSRADFGIPRNRVLYGSVQSLFKYLPQYDFVFPAIARRVPKAFFVFVGNPSDCVTATFKERLTKAFDQSGLDFEKYVKILPLMPLSRFMQLLGVLDVNLDSIGWTGGITTVNSFAMNCPVVTLPGEFMRGRHSSAMLKMIGVEELIANSLDEYISLSARIGSNKKLRSTIVEKIKARKSRLFGDKKCTELLDRFFKSRVSEYLG